MRFDLDDYYHIKNNTKLILITPHGRCGSIFVQGLFDNHSEMISLPYFINHYNINYETQDINEKIDNFFKLNKEFLNVSEHLGIGFENVEPFDINRIRKLMIKTLSSLGSNTNKDMLCSLFYAYSCICNKDISIIKYLVVHIHLYDAVYNHFSFDYKATLKHHENIMKDFNSKLYIALIGHPTLSISSYIRNDSSLQNLVYHINYIINCYYSLDKISKFYPKDTFAINIDLLNESKGRILFDRLALFGVKYEASLGFPSVAGKIYGIKGKSISNVHIFDTVSFERKIKSILNLCKFSKKYQYIAFAKYIFEKKIGCTDIKTNLLLNIVLFKSYIIIDIFSKIIKCCFKINPKKHYEFQKSIYKSIISIHK